ncbi:hypothetical protein CAI21_08875 [Alkalilimnicola ehrlichii]|uniref:Uncharacterized protein n=1 Tax=Alkalilimnicola ehrlichii TaxID=351052 RepID=A0A3E0WX70_9GAMM|nr:hypothetical protein [Alkalilimnicola ehrlichii]RFA29928.1 hypothetical protein CAI21_08875 [Alkalilimnicola ehrlichii]RFA36517.1 hypothetical protein CAL65_11150 [Alkalilimnicola ehrlichii]
MADQDQKNQPPERKVGIYDRPEQKPADHSRRNWMLLVLAMAFAIAVIVLLVWSPAQGAQPYSQSEPITETTPTPPLSPKVGSTEPPSHKLPESMVKS